MCGRYSLIASVAELAERFEFDPAGIDHPPRYNVAPTQGVLTVVAGDARRAVRMRWGLIPGWTTGAPSGRPMINARAETAAQRPSFREALRRRRCLVPADGFYEWRRTAAGRRPMRITLASGEPFALAGLWERWRGPGGEDVLSCAVLTTASNELMRPIHDRMPVIVPRGAEELWLDASVREPAALGPALAPRDPERMRAVEVSTLVNSPANDGPEVLAGP